MKAGVCVFFLLCVFAWETNARQEDALTRLRRAKFNKDVEIDTKFYEGFNALDQTQILSQVGLKEKDQIERLLGQPIVKFDQYGGYVTVNETNGRAFFYYFVEAEESKESKPLLLWLNGGPGCSSLAYGAMSELGPFRVNSDGKTLFYNPYAWNKVANVLFLESPAGVGFSYSNTTSDLRNNGDKLTATDNYAFLVNWLERFPEYKDRDFFISGESYAGHYVPQLTQAILQQNKASKNKINLKGIIIGNAVINDETDSQGNFDYDWGHALLSDEAIENIHKYCDFSPTASNLSPQCMDAVSESYDNRQVIDPYNIYAPLCQSENVTEIPKESSVIIDPCSDYYVMAYFNNPVVQEALHANVTKISYDWEPCNGIVNMNWTDSASTVLPLLQEFMANGLRVWYFSGDVDSIVSFSATTYSLRKLNLPVKTKFHPWMYNGEVGGYTFEYKGDLTFATVRGAGHQVPSYQAERALSLITHFLEGKPLPSPPN